ncbi:Abi-alpha family protein [Acidovorax sp. MR-S7]|uniref:Abi-alpha family protein n=1 Tax=Acidovorax sp. MR-S7 TaxID=1268622 RepID=UPI0003D3EAEF|nr:Abi-alpha family protein [Acidovorax sp. MR-S7]GAD22056.1 hypothetical protein AVS7_01816 [Acidovorax sp. MR-S7]
MDDDAMVEGAKAIQEVAKTANTGLETLQKSGGYLAQLFSGVLEQWFGIKEDNLRFKRASNLFKLHQKLEAELHNLGVPQSKLDELPLNFLLPALSEASLEGDEEVLEIWARLVANSVQSGKPRVAFVSILKEMTPLDARVFAAIYSISSPSGRFVQVAIEGLPDKVEIIQEREYSRPSSEVIESLANLERLGIIAFGTSWSGGEVFERANQTTLGQALFNAIKPHNDTIMTSS